MIKDIKFYDTDPRVRRYVLPTRIVKTYGAVENAECLLNYRNRQIWLQDKDLMVMTTTAEEKAGILLDFGTEFHGGACITMRKKEGEGRVRLCFGESVAEALSHIGERGACNDHSARDFEVTLENYSTNEYAATGYRFLYIELLSEGFINVKGVQGIAVYRDYEYVGSFECDNPLLNRIYDTAAYTCHLCMQNELWDGIKRDRLVWIGDVAPELKTIKYVFGDVPDLYRALKASAEDAPMPLWINKHPTYSLWWLINLEEWCHYTGRAEYIEEQRDYIRDLTAQILDSVDDHGFFTPDSFLDWPSKAYPEIARCGIRAVLLWAMEAASKLNRHLGYEALAAQCDGICELIKKSRHGAGHLKQVAAMLVLGDLHTEECAKMLAENGAEGFSTFMSYYLLSAMAKCTSTEETLKALCEYYGAMLDLGATTFWEDFDLKWAENAFRIDELPVEGKSDVHGDNGNYCYKGFRHSLCHGWASGPVAFLTEHVLGVTVKGIGCSEIEITPHLGDLSFARGAIATPAGRVEILHEKNEDGSIKTTVNAPEGISVTVKEGE